MPADKKPYNKQFIENLLLISGTRRNCGKTTLACEIIKNMAKTTAVYALKISPHFHQLNDNQELLVQEKGFNVFREKDAHSTKDSSRMLKAGAIESLYLQCEDQTMPEVFKQVIEFLPKDVPVVCESGSLSKSLQPGLHLFLENGNKKNKHYDTADRIIHFNGDTFDLNIDQIVFDGNTWKLQ